MGLKQILFAYLLFDEQYFSKPWLVYMLTVQFNFNLYYIVQVGKLSQ